MKQMEGKYVPLVLTELSILKEDMPPFILEDYKKETGFVGVSNFRKIGNIFGLSQPITEGIHNLATYYKKKIIWINLREQPVIYINGLPFLLKDKKAPFSNIKSFVGISYKRMEEMEKRLKKDIQELANRSGGFIKVYTEKTPKTLWASNIYVRQVQTVREVFNEINGIRYYRVPINRINCKESFISVLDIILSKEQKELGEAYHEYSIGFNSSTGLNKTSYGMSICLLREAISNQHLLDDTAHVPSFPRVIHSLEKVFPKKEFAAFLMKSGNVIPVLEKALKGEYVIIERLANAMDLPEVRELVNAVINSIEYNLLAVLLENILAFQCHGCKKALKKSMFLLEKYASLILYAIYKQQKTASSFVDWIENSSIAQGIIQEVTSAVPSKNLFSPAVISQASTVDKEWTAIIGIGTVLQADRDMNATFEKERVAAEKMSIPVMQMHQPNKKTDMSFICEQVLWINLRAEPIVYIEGVPHSERDRIDPTRNIRTIPGITEELVNNQEKILIRRIQDEGSQQQGEVLLFTTESNKINTKHANVKEKNVQTCEEFISKINPKQIKYIRVPMVSKAPLNPNILDLLYTTLVTHRSMPVILQASGYLGRNKIVKVISLLIEKAEERKSATDDLPRMPRPILIRSIETLVRILKNGIESEIIVRSVWSDMENKDIYSTHLTPDFSQKNLIDYMLLIVLTSYMLENNTCPFRVWINKREDILHIYESCVNDRKLLEQGGMHNELENAQNSPDEEDKKKRVELINRPWGQVLTPHTILKNDFFPALRILKSNTIDIKGCSNFRAVEFNRDTIVGLAQPTSWGVQSLVEYLNGSRPCSEQSGKHCIEEEFKKNASGQVIHWFCLRQEPIVYIDGFPFVLRITDMIYENVITEGINRKWVEDIEERMKNDCLEESEKEGLILHNEEIQDGEAILSSETVVSRNILTPKEIFINKNLKYYRMPISDEQAPLPEIFDELYRIIMAAPKPRMLVFSCQMGRGRTTTGMVISRLIGFTEYINTLTSAERKSILKEKRSQVEYADSYIMISKLIQVLPMGRESKNLVDSIIKECGHIQNIYEAIAFRKDNTEYLMRYFYLICFGSFLLEGNEKTFSGYLCDRIEINVIANEREY
ncbi:uncharacterized protein NESG_01371 [Nematocida ausubeli]|uniref:Tyrosine specific protein phosphatases domain-containing protein n=1 Tax=Nematocida ausubeli (strain ATCC PRA-371 / ERTm2) TaxID=1913371 RepID=A0A086J284_NEMA1|nr:uncharacterized protein NESG_01371 [Nematocida ausubeli]KFG26252.1 hypothetical protein NESG_01371 [Nematocida ausubeli]